MWVYPDRIEFGDVTFSRRRKNGKLGEKPLEQGKDLHHISTYNKFYRVRQWTFTRRVLFLPFCGFWHATGNCSKLRVEDSSVFRDHQKVIDINSVISAVEILFHKEVAPTAGSRRFKNAA